MTVWLLINLNWWLVTWWFAELNIHCYCTIIYRVFWAPSIHHIRYFYFAYTNYWFLLIHIFYRTLSWLLKNLLSKYLTKETKLTTLESVSTKAPLKILFPTGLEVAWFIQIKHKLKTEMSFILYFFKVSSAQTSYLLAKIHGFISFIATNVWIVIKMFKVIKLNSKKYCFYDNQKIISSKKVCESCDCTWLSIIYCEYLKGYLIFQIKSQEWTFNSHESRGYTRGSV